MLVVVLGVAHLAMTGRLTNPFGAWISDPNDPNNVTIEAAIREEIWKPTGKLTKADLDKLTELNLAENQISEADIKALKAALPNCEIEA